MPSGRKDDKQQAGDEPNSHRNYVQNLLGLVIWPRIIASQHILVPQSHRSEHEDRQNRVNDVDEAQPVLAEVGNPGAGRGGGALGVEEPHATGRGKAVVDLSVGGPEAVGEAGEEARGGQGEEEEEGEGAGGRVARAVVCEDRREELERQESAGREEVGQVGDAR
ncbi:hypothetical protein RHGRI_032163 [Rhododendron griersonianum]|uniref:Uncharacterized protein n=1 Tax=Rhododendron griersonianum TaxID=479676 RepID=A0AAV6IEC4_9ERIC|nr:hypothetical protein RHGRI_032163 [Rhododendron griersonianum]